MEREAILRLIAQHAAELRDMGVVSLALFGSAGRDEAGPQSDVDMLVELRPGVGLLGLLRVQHRLQEILGAPVDLVTRAGIHPALRDRILSEAVDVLPAA